MNIRTTSLKLGTKQNAFYFVECVLFYVRVAALHLFCTEWCKIDAE